MKNQIRAWRKHRGLTQAELAAKSQTSPETISRIETGARGLRDFRIDKLAKVLGCTPTQLLSEPPDAVLAPQNETSRDNDSMPVEQMLVRLLRDLAAQQERQNQALAELTQVLERLERILTLPDRTRTKTAR